MDFFFKCRKELDIISAGPALNAARCAAVDCSIPFFARRKKLLAYQPPGGRTRAVNTWVYMEIFPKSAWATLTCLMAVVVACLVATAMWRNNSSRDLLKPSVAATFLTLLQLSVDNNSLRTHCRSLLLIWSAGAYFLFAYYTSDLTAQMTSRPAGIPIKSFEDVIRLGYRVSVFAGTATAGLLATAEEGSAMRRVHETRVVRGSSNEDTMRLARTEPKTLAWLSESYVSKDVVALDIREASAHMNAYAPAS